MARPKGSKNKRPIKKDVGIKTIPVLDDAPKTEMTVDTVIEPQVLTRAATPQKIESEWNQTPVKLSQLRPCPKCNSDKIYFDTFNHDHSVQMLCHYCKHTSKAVHSDTLSIDKLKYMAMAEWNKQ